MKKKISLIMSVVLLAGVGFLFSGCKIGGGEDKELSSSNNNQGKGDQQGTEEKQATESTANNDFEELDDILKDLNSLDLSGEEEDKILKSY